MLRRIILTASSLVTLVASPQIVQAQDLEHPEGWMTRFDHADASEADLDMFVGMPPGWHVTTGPAGIFYHPDNTASGDFRIEMEVFLFDPGQRREAFGIFLGGSDLQGAGQTYTYFLIRNGGQYIIKRREGADAPTVQPWTGHNSILSYSDRGDDTSVKNVLMIEAEGDRVRFHVNGDRVEEMSRADVGVDGKYGFRVNHGLNLHISRLDVTILER